MERADSRKKQSCLTKESRSDMKIMLNLLALRAKGALPCLTLLEGEGMNPSP